MSALSPDGRTNNRALRASGQSGFGLGRVRTQGSRLGGIFTIISTYLEDYTNKQCDFLLAQDFEAWPYVIKGAKV